MTWRVLRGIFYDECENSLDNFEIFDYPTIKEAFRASLQWYLQETADEPLVDERGGVFQQSANMVQEARARATQMLDSLDVPGTKLTRYHCFPDMFIEYQFKIFKVETESVQVTAIAMGNGSAVAAVSGDIVQG